jgi:addiction module RelE/StbE family toxin
MYKLDYTPGAKTDLQEIFRYITNVLKSQKAALNLQNEIDKKILRLCEYPFSCPRYQAPRQLQHEYRLLRVKSYYVVYTVSETTISILRVVYMRRELGSLLQ